MPAGAHASSKLFSRNQTLKQLLPRNKSTAHVVNPKLCDDAIQRLGSSLTSHIGCSIIDLNPGPALWSSKLHKALKPQSHILVEPDPKYHEPFLRPLLDAPSSKYRLKKWAISEAFDLDRYVNEGLIPNLPTKESSNERTVRANDAVLLIANFSSGDNRYARSRVSSNFRALAFGLSLQRMAGLHSRGPVRMLMWLPTDEKQSLLPRTVTHRDKLSILMESLFHIEEIVTASKSAKQRRETFLDIASGKRVVRRMHDAGIQIPLDRQDETQKRIRDILSNSGNNEVAQVKDDLRDWEKELCILEKKHGNKEFEEYVMPKGGKRKRDPRYRGQITPEFKRMQELRHLLRFNDKKKSVLDSLLADEDQIDALQIKILHGNLGSQEREKAILQRDHLYESFKAQLENSATLVPKQLGYQGDDRRAFALEPPLLMWDRRLAEPLVAQENEFLNQKRMSLLDFRPLIPNPYAITPEQSLCVNAITRQLLHNGTQTVKQLDQLAPGAFEALAPLVPSLSDPLKGGRAIVNELRTRCLTPEMANGLADAWEKWALRPDLLELIGRGSDAEDILLTELSSPSRGALGKSGA